jgi:hypothetical protein
MSFEAVEALETEVRFTAENFISEKRSKAKQKLEHRL